MYSRPPRRRCWRPAATLLAVVALALGAVSPQRLSADAPAIVEGWCSDSLRPTDNWNALSVEMRVTGRRITAKGDLASAPAPGVTYRIERSSASGSWKTVISGASSNSILQCGIADLVTWIVT